MKKLRLLVSALVLGLSTVLPLLSPALVHALPNTCTWTGATNNNFNTAGNWSSCNSTVPQTGDSLVFDVTSLSASKTLTNDIVGLSVANVTFQGTNASFFNFTIGGTNAITVTTALAVSSATFAEITAPVTLGGNVAISAATDGVADLEGVLSGSHNITTSGIVYLNGVNTFTGTVTASAGTLAVSAAGLGNAANAVTVSDGADIAIGGCSDTAATIANPITLTGASSSPSGSSPVAKLSTGQACSGGGGGVSEFYGRAGTTDQTYTLSGAVTLGSDVTFGGRGKETTLTGALSGAHTISLPNNYGGALIVNSSSNTSSLANGTYEPDPITATLSDSQPSNTVLIGTAATVTIDGTRGDTQVSSGGTLKGTGTVGALAVDQDGTVAPGHSPGCITSGDLVLAGNYQAELGGTDACTGYDQLKVTGTVTLNDGTNSGVLQVSLYNGYKPSTVGKTYTIIDNDGSDAVTGTFANMAEGSTFTVDSYVFKISYKGGDGNDVVLTVQPGGPNTGFALIKNNPLVSAAGVFAAAGGVAYFARRNKKLVSHRR